MARDVIAEEAQAALELLSELATSTYRAAKRQGFKDAFIDIQLDLWDAHQEAAVRVRVRAEASRPKY
jgi:hypothetical protein